MTRIQLTNLISYWLLMTSDKNYQSSPDYISEKYDLFFNNKPVNIDKHYLEYINKSEIFKRSINENMKRWNIKVTDNNFYKFYITNYLVYSFSAENFLIRLIKRYKSLFGDNDSLSKELKISVLHPVLKDSVFNVISNNKLLYRNIFVRELSNKIKQNHI